MSAIARRAAFQVRTRAAFAPRVAHRSYAEQAASQQRAQANDSEGETKVNLQEGAKRDPELFVRRPSPNNDSQISDPANPQLPS